MIASAPGLGLMAGALTAAGTHGAAAAAAFLDDPLQPVRWLLRSMDSGVLVYFFVINSSYLILVVLAAAEFTVHLRRKPFAGYDEMDASPLTPPVSVIVPAYNEEPVILESVKAMLALRYPQFEVVLVDDGSKDRTVEVLGREYDLVEVPRVVPDEIPTRVPVRSVLVPRSTALPLVVVRKDNSGRSDAVNMGINVARYPLVCIVDADSLLDPEALLCVAKPFCDDPLRVVASGGVVRVANGCTVVAGRVVDAKMPRGWITRIQVLEYLRAFLVGRTGWSRFGGLLIISGAFGLFRRDLVVEVGGLDADCIGEDAELVVRLHRHLRRQRRDYRIIFVSEPVNWTEVPSSRAVLARQRARWHRGLAEVLWKHRRMMGNPAYGRIGLVAMPYFLIFELFAPLVELAGVVLLPVSLAMGAVNLDYLWRFVLIAYGYGLLLTLIALAVEEYSFHRYKRWQDLGAALLASVAENLGYRQLTAVWRLRGWWAALAGREQVWGVMTREGFATTGTTGTPGGPT